ncbi:endopeptidase La [Succinimonas amylolytica]|uniref:endopeptidase La n=1 Tax=Succinimonas amylolytica TaxID=83769 RepID=UPI000365A613|nr:endopeptidase La [Succinimonas amylolytica]
MSDNGNNSNSGNNGNGGDSSRDGDSAAVENVQEEKAGRLKKELSVPEKERPPVLCVLPVFGRPFMPSQVIPVQLAPRWEKALRKTLDSPSKMVLLVAVPEGRLESDLREADFMKMGCLVRVIQARVGEELQFIAQGVARGRVSRLRTVDGCIEGDIEYPECQVPATMSPEGIEIKAYAMSILSTLKELMPLNPLYFEELKQYLTRFNPNDPSMLADCAASITTSEAEQLQNVLETVDLLPRMKLSLGLLKNEVEIAKLQKSIKDTVAQKLSDRQKEFFLKEQLREIQKELGITVDDKTADVNRFREKMEKLNPPEQVQKKFADELNRLSVLEPASAEYAVCRDYLTWLTNIPWGIYADQNFDYARARKILEEDHEGLKDVKDRILEYLAVGAFKLRNQEVKPQESAAEKAKTAEAGLKAESETPAQAENDAESAASDDRKFRQSGDESNGAILLFVGPPGVGKTSIGKSIARALNRPFFRLSLGGMRDEAEIKGHRRTYVGALPGRMVQALKEAQVMNPVIMLDEIDKLSHDSFRGDPASTLLETLDPEQNSGFLDNYLDLRLDLSKCLFICTANSMDTIPAPLLDRLDAITLSGYLAEEKMQIAKKHLIPKIFKKDGVPKNKIKIRDTALRKIVDEYAREAGVRSLEKAIAKISRKAVTKFLEDENLANVTVTPDDIKGYLGVAPFTREKTISGVGVVTGLAWTSVGGATLPIEAELVDNSARGFKLTGNLGQVMKESAEISLSYVISHLRELAPDTDPNFFEKALVHLHVPEGATPKDGPSAGVTMASAFLSLALNRAPNPGFAMTGEISLTGSVLAIGGVREKVIAAKRIGIYRLIVPKANMADVEELPEYVRDGVEFFYADVYKDVADILFSDKYAVLPEKKKTSRSKAAGTSEPVKNSEKPETDKKPSSGKKTATKSSGKAAGRKTKAGGKGKSENAKK